MFKNLSPGAIGIKSGSLAESIELARKGGFAGVTFSIVEAARLADEQGAEGVRALFAAAGVRPGSWGLPVDWRAADDKFEASLAALPGLAALGAAIGCNRTETWLPSWSDERPYAANWDFHVQRFGAIARVLEAQGCRIGLEFLGPKTLRAGKAHEFLHSMGEILDLARAIGTGNVGLLLDAWHLYTAGGAAADVRGLTNADVVTVHVNDAPAGIPIDQQIDSVRALPLETGVIDLPAFLKALAGIGYDGPVTPEPFSARLRALPPDEALSETAAAMARAWQAAGL